MKISLPIKGLVKYQNTGKMQNRKIKMERNFYIPKLQNEDAAKTALYSIWKAFSVQNVIY